MLVSPAPWQSRASCRRQVRKQRRGLRVFCSWQNLFTNGAIEFDSRFFREHLQFESPQSGLSIYPIRIQQLQNSELPFLVSHTRDSAEVCSGLRDLASVLLNSTLSKAQTFECAGHLGTDATFDGLPPGFGALLLCRPPRDFRLSFVE